jgi:hypothetical protein
MSVGFLSPSGALVALAALVPLGAFVLLERRMRRVTETLGVAPPPLARRLSVPLALTASAVLVALAAAEPVLGVSETRQTAARAEIVFVLDTSRSMGAAAAPDAPTRLDRAKAIVADLRARLGDVPAGIASLTDRALPHLFPSADPRVFAATLSDAIAIGSPPPNGGVTRGRSTDLTALAAVPRTGFFLPSASRRLVIFLSDDETVPVSAPVIGAAFRRPPAARVIFVHVWSSRDRIWVGGRADPGYRPDPSSNAVAKLVAGAAGGRAFAEGQTAAVAAAARSAVAGGGTVPAKVSETRRPIGGWLALAAALPLGLVLRARNVGGGRLETA